MRHAYRDKRRRRTAGFTVLEMLAAVAVMGVLLGLFLNIFTNASRLSILNARTFGRIRVAEDLRREFREAVQLASGVAEGVGEYRTGDKTLVLTLPEDRFIVIGRDEESKHIFRLDLEKKAEELEALRFSRFSLPVSELRFTCETENLLSARLLTLHAGVAGDSQKQPVSPWHVEATAALRHIGKEPAGGAADE